jgi:hypothetical protein
MITLEAHTSAYFDSVNFNLEEFDVRLGYHSAALDSDINTGSPHAMAVANRWLRTCRTSPTHEKCRESNRMIMKGSGNRLPTRLLHVGSDSKDPVLIESGGVEAKYCILSYCWGTAGTLSLRRTTCRTA